MRLRALAVLLVLLALPALALPGVARAQASYGQYLVVIDDSGSMDGSDPRRLVVMASMALTAGLEDGDQVMLVGLNELASGGTTPRFVSPRELLPERAAAGGDRALEGERPTRLAAHEGQTPCRAALDRARDLLNTAASAGAPQTLLFLTDGACNGGAVEPAAAYLPSLRAHREGRFRFVFLTRDACAGRRCRRAAQPLDAYAHGTGWSGDTAVTFDSRALLRAFADVLSFSRGLRFDEGGRIGLERTFAGARTVRVLAIRDQGEGAIGLERVDRNGATAPIEGGPTFRDPTHGWSFRSATLEPRPEPFAVRSDTPGVDVLVIPVYGRLRIDAILAPCGDPPAPPWPEEVAVRSGQPACAHARLVGDTGETIVPGSSLEFGMESDGTAMQPGEGGIFHAQLGAIPEGRHDRRFEASGGALAAPVVATRGVTAMSFGVHRVALASEPERALAELDVGELPQPVARDLTLRYAGSFPPGQRGRARCEVEASPELAGCVRCETTGADDLALQDGLEVHAIVRGRPFCGSISESDGAPRPLRMRIVLEPIGTSEMAAHSLPLAATLRYAHAAPIAIEVDAGETIEREVRVPGPLAQTAIRAHVEGLGDGIEITVPTGATGTTEVHADADGTIALTLRAAADDCCGAGPRDAFLVLASDDDPASVRVPLRVEVQAPSFWTCPGKQIAMALAALLALALLVWLVHGFVSPQSFAPGALLLSAASLDELIALREGDDGWRMLKRFPEAKRGFRRSAAVWLGGPRAPLPSLRRMAADGRIEALPGGGAQLVVLGPGIERWNEGEGAFVELEKGSYPVPSRVRLRRGEELFLEMRR